MSDLVGGVSDGRSGGPSVGRSGSRQGGRRNALLIARREYLDRVPTRTFLAATIVLAVVAVGLALAPIGLRYLDRGSVTKVGILAAEPTVRANATTILDGMLNRPPVGVDPQAWQKPYRFVPVTDVAAGVAAVDDGRLRGVLTITRAADGGLDFTYRTSASADSVTSQIMSYASFGVGILDTGASFRPPTYQVVSTSGPIDQGRPIDPQQIATRSILATILIVLIFVTLTVYGMWVATSVASEKSTRVMELLISAATPRELLIGKVLGVGGAGLSQYAAILIPAGIVVVFQDRIAELLLGPAPIGQEAPLAGLTLPILGAFLLFFLLGFVLYALLYAAAGSLVSRQEDVQQLALPLSLISMASYIAAAVGLSSIGSVFVIVLSFVPFSSPFMMLARIMLGRVEPWEVALSALILVASSLLILRLAARIYATGVLLYGQRPGARAFIKAARSAIG